MTPCQERIAGYDAEILRRLAASGEKRYAQADYFGLGGSHRSFGYAPSWRIRASWNSVSRRWPP